MVLNRVDATCDIAFAEKFFDCRFYVVGNQFLGTGNELCELQTNQTFDQSRKVPNNL